MKAKLEKMLDLLGSQVLRFKIPLFQRSYTWSEEQCEELWRDIKRSAKTRQDHFSGSVLYLPQPASEAGSDITDNGQVRIVNVVDGQQRLCTLTLIMLAFARQLEQTHTALIGFDAAQLKESYLVHANGDRQLVLNEQDDPALATLLESPTAVDKLPDCPLTRNYALFRRLVCEPGFDAEELWYGLRQLVCIAIELDDDDGEQDVFESLNSKGVHLTTADLCRNYLLSGLSQSEQANIYRDWWEPIEDLFGDDPGSLRLNNAILGWLTIRYRRVRAKGDRQAYAVFKRFMQEEYTGTLTALLGELYSFCNVWAENYRYHAVKAYKSAANWATLGAKTLVSDRELKPASKEALQYYAEHFGVNTSW